MLVKNLASTNYLASANLVKIRENKNAESVSKKSSFGHNDSYIPSNSMEEVIEVKAKNLSEVRDRITSGFYNSTEVNDDLTEVFSGIFKKALPQPA